MSKKNLVSRTKSYLKYLYSDKIVPKLYPYIAKTRALIFNEKIVHVIGDSHTQAFNLKYPFIVHHLGATTAYNLDKRGSTTNSREQLEKIAESIDPKYESILLVFGEIDCRIHIYNQYRRLIKKVPIITMIRETIHRYGLAMNRLKKRKINFYVLSITPASTQGNVFNYQYYATFKQRADIHKLFNEELSKYCLSHNYQYIDLYGEVVNKSGGIKHKYLLDEVHLNSKTVEIVTNIIFKS